MEQKLNRGDIKMGSYISIGFVYDKLDLGQVKVELEKLTTYLITELDSIKNMKFSKDMDGEEWVEYSSFNNYQISDLCSLLAEHYFGQLNLECNLFELDNLEVTIRVEKEQDYYGFLLDMSETELIKTGDLEEIDDITEKIINFVTDLHKALIYDYAFCDNEAEIQHSPREFKELKNAVYSIVVIPTFEKQEKSFNVIKSNWHIDGLTIRN